MHRSRNAYADANPAYKAILMGFLGAVIVAGLVWALVLGFQADQRWQAHCRDTLHGAVQTQTWSGYGYHTGSSGKMVYGYYSTQTTVCRLTSGPNAGAVIDTE